MSMSSGRCPDCKRAVLASKYAWRHSRAKAERASGGRADGRAAVMLECQSRQVPMKSKRTALMRPFWRGLG